MHLKSHGITTAEFKTVYPENNTCSEEYSRLRSEANKNQMEKIHSNSNKEYLKNRYKNVGAGRKKAWNNCSEEKRKEIAAKCCKTLIEYNNNIENKNKKYKKIAESLRNYYKNMDPETKLAILKNSIFKIRRFGGHKISKCIGDIEYKFRSVPEIWIAETLEELKINWEYESLRILYVFENKQHIYVPDFYLKDYNLVIEFKGYNFIEEHVQECKEYYTKKAGYNYSLVMYKPKNELVSYIKQILNR